MSGIVNQSIIKHRVGHETATNLKRLMRQTGRFSSSISVGMVLVHQHRHLHHHCIEKPNAYISGAGGVANMDLSISTSHRMVAHHNSHQCGVALSAASC